MFVVLGEKAGLMEDTDALSTSEDGMFYMTLINFFVENARGLVVYIVRVKHKFSSIKGHLVK